MNKNNISIILIALILSIYFSVNNIEILKHIPSIPIASWADILIEWLKNNLEPLFDFISYIIASLNTSISIFLTGVPSLVVLVVISALALLLAGYGVATFVVLGLLFIVSMGYWSETMTTLSLVLSSTIIALIIGIPLGILKAHFKTMERILDPILDFMQTMPLFVYLIPAVMFFGIGDVPGIVATFIFSMPPAVRLTSLGIQQIGNDLVEAGKAFGSSYFQFLFKVELPLAMPSIMMGVNQTIMLSLSMVVVASMIGAEGLGSIVYSSITTLDVGKGIASGLAIVLLAMILDRITRKFGLKQG